MRGRWLVLVAVAMAGCGDDEKAAPAATPAAKAAGPPAELLGTYTTRLKAADIADPAPDLLDGEYRWTLRVTKDGGPDNAPALTIIHTPDDEVLESSKLTVSGDTIKLTGQECEKESGGYEVVSSSYHWKVAGAQLRLTPVATACPDKIAETILSSEPWKRAG